MKKIGVVEKTTEDSPPQEEVNPADLKKEKYEVLAPHYNRELKKFYISKVMFNPEEFETYEMQEKGLAKQFESEQGILTTFFKRYKREKK